MPFPGGLYERRLAPSAAWVHGPYSMSTSPLASWKSFMEYGASSARWKKMRVVDRVEFFRLWSAAILNVCVRRDTVRLLAIIGRATIAKRSSSLARPFLGGPSIFPSQQSKSKSGSWANHRAQRPTQSSIRYSQVFRTRFCSSRDSPAKKTLKKSSVDIPGSLTPDATHSSSGG